MQAVRALLTRFHSTLHGVVFAILWLRAVSLASTRLCAGSSLGGSLPFHVLAVQADEIDGIERGLGGHLKVVVDA